MNLPKPPEFEWNHIEPAIDRTGSIEPIRAIALVNAFIADAWKRLFEGSQNVYLEQHPNGEMSEHVVTDQGPASSHRAIMLKAEPIQKGVSKDEITAVLRNTRSTVGIMRQLADRIEREGLR